MMKTSSLLLTAHLLFLMNFYCFSQSSDSLQIRSVIEKSYINGLINAKDFQQAREGIHKNFRILGHKGDSLTEKSRDKWIAQRKKRLHLTDADYKIWFIDIVGDAAVSKIEMFRGNIRAVDYLFLYKFENDWKIVSAIDHVKRQSKK